MNILILPFLIGMFFPTPAIASTTPPISPYVPPTEVFPPILDKIAICESNNMADAKNPYSTASGRFQFLDSSWKYYGKKLWGDDLKNKDKLNYKDSTELALFAYNLNGTKDWLASKPCWSALKDV